MRRFFILFAAGLLAATAQGAWTRRSPAGAGGGRDVSLQVGRDGRSRLVYVEDGLVYGEQTLSGWSFAVIDPDPSVRACRLALDGGDAARVSYYSPARGEVRYAAQGPSGWTFQAVEPLAAFFGENTAIALDPVSGGPALAYAVEEGGQSVVRYAAWTGVDWSTATAHDASPVGEYVALALDAAGGPHIAAYDMEDGDLLYIHRSGAFWTSRIADNAKDVGYYPSIALDAFGAPRIAYFDLLNENLKFAWKDGSVWRVRTVDAEGEAGGYLSMALDASGQAHISYERIDDAYERFRIGYARGHGADWTLEEIDPDTGDGGIFYNALALDPAGRPRVAYSNGDVLTYAVPLAAPSDVVPAAWTADSLEWRWRNNDPSALGLRVRRASDGADLSGDLPPGTTAWTQSGLPPDAPQRIFVQAFDDGGVADAPPSAEAFTLARLPADPAFLSVAHDAVELAWSANGNPLDTLYRVAASPPDGPAVTASTAAVRVRVPGLRPGTSYSVTVLAVNHAGLETAPTPPLAVVTLPALLGSCLVAGGQPARVSFELAGFPACGAVDVPAGAFDGPVAIEVRASTAPPAAAGQEAAGAGLTFRITMDPPLPPRGGLDISLCAAAAGEDGRRWLLAGWDGAPGRWRTLDTSFDGARLAARAPGAALFQWARALPRAGFDLARLYPNPFRPDRGQGRMTFDGLPEGARLEIFTASGRLCRVLHADAAGRAFWDGREDGGEDAASGVYFVAAEAGGRRQVFKAMVQR